MKKNEETIELTFDTRSPLSFADAVIGYLYDRSGGNVQMYIEELGIVAKTLSMIYLAIMQAKYPLDDKELPI